MLIELCLFSALVRHPVNFLDAAHNEMVRERQVCGHYLKPSLQKVLLQFFFCPSYLLNYYILAATCLTLFQLVEQAKRLSEDIMAERIKVCFRCSTFLYQVLLIA